MSNFKILHGQIILTCTWVGDKDSYESRENCELIPTRRPPFTRIPCAKHFVPYLAIGIRIPRFNVLGGCQTH